MFCEKCLKAKGAHHVCAPKRKRAKKTPKRRRKASTPKRRKTTTKRRAAPKRRKAPRRRATKRTTRRTPRKRATKRTAKRRRRPRSIVGATGHVIKLKGPEGQRVTFATTAAGGAKFKNSLGESGALTQTDARERIARLLAAGWRVARRTGARRG